MKVTYTQDLLIPPLKFKDMALYIASTAPPGGASMTVHYDYLISFEDIQV